MDKKAIRKLSYMLRQSNKRWYLLSRHNKMVKHNLKIAISNLKEGNVEDALNVLENNLLKSVTTQEEVTESWVKK